jgi:hypothetical protein
MDFVETLARQLDEKFRPEAIAAVERASRAAAEGMAPSTAMTFITAAGVRIAPAASGTYLKALWCFARDKPYDDGPLGSAASEPIVAACQQALADLFRSDAVRDSLGELLAGDAFVAACVQANLRSEAKWLGGEAQSLMGVSPTAAVVGSDYAAGYASAAVNSLLGSAAGKAIIAGVAKVVGTAQGKILLAKLISAAAAKVAASTAMKLALTGALKKVGVTILVKAVLVKLIAVAFPTLVAVKIPIFWVVLPILLLLLRNEINNIPAKLARDVSPLVAKAVGDSFPDICSEFARLLVAETSQQLKDQADAV